MIKMGKKYNILNGKPEKKRELGRQRRRWKDNMCMNLRETGWEVVEWMQPAKNRAQFGGLLRTRLP
jgi:hypothetical protein